MNKNVVYVAVFAVLCVLAGVLVGAGIAKKAKLHGPYSERLSFAQKAEHFMGRGQRWHGAKKGGAGRLEMLTDKLGLSKEQKTKIKDILEKTRQEIDAVGKNIRSAIVEIKDKTDKQIMDILTSEQQEKFKALQKEFKRGCGTAGPEKRLRSRYGHEPIPDEDLPPPR